ncbi:MAG: fibronectin type III domain-containing protein [Pseudomonadales bacterium]
MSCTHRVRGLRQGLSVAFLTLVVAGCSDGGGDDDPVYSAAELNIAGSVGDGPVVNADLSFIDADGVVIGQAVSDDRANYQFVVPAATALPVRVVASGGTDLVTGRPLDFDLVGVLGEDADSTGSTLNLSPLSTMTVRALECTGARFNYDQLTTMWNLIRGQVGMGLNEQQLPNPLFDEISADNVAGVVFASEALAEVIRRTSVALTNAGFDTPPADVFSKVACDLSVDHQIDGLGNSTDQRVSAVYRAASAAVAIEVAAGRLEVDNQVATALLDASIAQIMPDAAGQTVLSVALSDSLQSQMLNDLLLLQHQFDDPALVSLIDKIRTATPGDLQRALNDGSLNASQSSLTAAVTATALADTTLLSGMAFDMAAQEQQSAPFISLFASQDRVTQGEPITFSWAASEASRCSADGAWSGEKELSGSETVAGPATSTDYALTCMSLGGINTATVSITVLDSDGDELEDPTPPVDPVLPEGPADPEQTPQPEPPEEEGTPGSGGGTPPAPEPEPEPEVQPPVTTPAGPDVNLRASSTTVSSGDSITLTWDSTDADSCVAQGAWSGSRALSGSLDSGPLSSNARFELVCSNADSSSSAIAIVQVAQDGTLQLSWNRPTENEDGSPLNNLSSYKIYYGQTPGQYTEEFQVNDPDATSTDLTLPQGSYYVVVTAVDSAGLESSYSNEIVEQSR